MIDPNDGLERISVQDEYIPNFVAIYYEDLDGNLTLMRAENIGHRYSFADYLDDVEAVLTKYHFCPPHNCFKVFIDPEGIPPKGKRTDSVYFDSFEEFLQSYEYRA